MPEPTEVELVTLAHEAAVADTWDEMGYTEPEWDEVPDDIGCDRHGEVCA